MNYTKLLYIEVDCDADFRCTFQLSRTAQQVTLSLTHSVSNTPFDFSTTMTTMTSMTTMTTMTTMTAMAAMTTMTIETAIQIESDLVNQ